MSEGKQNMICTFIYNAREALVVGRPLGKFYDDALTAYCTCVSSVFLRPLAWLSWVVVSRGAGSGVVAG